MCASFLNRVLISKDKHFWSTWYISTNIKSNIKYNHTTKKGTILPRETLSLDDVGATKQTLHYPLVSEPVLSLVYPEALEGKGWVSATSSITS